jgi:hypothetical protein
MNTNYPLTSFFRTPEAVQELQQVLDDDSKKVIILTGSGGNGKTQLCRQLSETHPGKFSVYHDEGLDALPARIAADIAGGRRALVCTNEVPNLKGLEGNVIFMDRTFGSLTPCVVSTAH